MTTGASPGSSRITLLGIALIWMTAQVLVAVVHDCWISRGGWGHQPGSHYADERGVHMLIENNMAALRRELEDAGVEFIDLGRTEVPGVRLESEMGRSEMRPSRLALYLGALLLPLNAAAQSPAFSV